MRMALERVARNDVRYRAVLARAREAVVAEFVGSSAFRCGT
jgi:hypothetical protein